MDGFNLNLHLPTQTPPPAPAKPDKTPTKPFRVRVFLNTVDAGQEFAGLKSYDDALKVMLAVSARTDVKRAVIEEVN